MENKIEVMQHWMIKVPHREGPFKVKVVMVAPNMIGVKEGSYNPQYYAPDEIVWLEQLAGTDK